jgi:hypothetical protein
LIIETGITVEIDKDVAGKLLITVAHDGFLKRLKQSKLALKAFGAMLGRGQNGVL